MNGKPEPRHGRKFRLTVELEQDAPGSREGVIEAVKEALRAVEWEVLGEDRLRFKKVRMKVAASAPEQGQPVVFIYDPGSHGPCHAVLATKEGRPAGHHGFCGVEPSTGPKAHLDRPDGGLCRECAKYVVQVGGKRGTVYDAPIPERRRPYAHYQGYEDD